MGKLACRLCIAAGFVALVLHIAATCVPWYTMTGFISGVGWGIVEYDIFLWKVRVRFDVQLWDWQGKNGKILKSVESLNWLGVTEQDIRKDSGGKKYFDMPTYKVFQLANNNATYYLKEFLPRLPFFGSEGYALFFGGMIVLLLSVLAAIASVMGASYLFYYSEKKQTKKARKGATIFYSIMPIISMVNVVIAFMVLLMTGHTGDVFVFWSILTPKSATLPYIGFWLTIFNLIVCGTLICFQKFWKDGKSELMRTEKKELEKDREFLRLMGLSEREIDRDTSSTSSSSDYGGNSSYETSTDDDETEFSDVDEIEIQYSKYDSSRKMNSHRGKNKKVTVDLQQQQLQPQQVQQYQTQNQFPYQQNQPVGVGYHNVGATTVRPVPVMSHQVVHGKHFRRGKDNAGPQRTVYFGTSTKRPGRQ